MITRKLIADTAMSWLDCPYHHHQGLKGVAVDCVHLVWRVGQEIGLIPEKEELPHYEPLARGSYMIRMLKKWLIKCNDIAIGNVLVIRFGGLDTHTGIVVSETHFIHASNAFGKVVLSRIDDYLNNIVAIYQVEGAV